MVEICRLRLQTMKPRNLFGFGASFTLAAIYSRGTCRPTTIDVLMFHFRVRNGTGWGHQAMTTRFQGASLSLAAYLGNHLRLRVAVLCAGCRLVGSRLTSAWLWVLRFPCFALTLGYISSSRNCLSPGWLYKVYWMLVVLGSIHYCNYTCTLSTWSSSTLL